MKTEVMIMYPIESIPQLYAIKIKRVKIVKLGRKLNMNTYIES